MSVRIIPVYLWLFSHGLNSTTKSLRAATQSPISLVDKDTPSQVNQRTHQPTGWCLRCRTRYQSSVTIQRGMARQRCFRTLQVCRPLVLHPPTPLTHPCIRGQINGVQLHESAVAKVLAAATGYRKEQHRWAESGPIREVAHTWLYGNRSLEMAHEYVANTHTFELHPRVRWL